MKQKYLILKGEDNKNIIIKEFAELDKDMLSLLCEQTYDIKGIKSAVSKGKDAVVSTIRTSNMYPAGVYAEKIADSVIALYKSKDQDSMARLPAGVDAQVARLRGRPPRPRSVRPQQGRVSGDGLRRRRV